MEANTLVESSFSAVINAPIERRAASSSPVTHLERQ
jgi:hypothetical protein